MAQGDAAPSDKPSDRGRPISGNPKGRMLFCQEEGFCLERTSLVCPATKALFLIKNPSGRMSLIDRTRL
jgi:hypothetical protein